jgi:hypothetical protein
MCTVTLIVTRHDSGPGVRLVHSRDEQRTRARAEPPRPIKTARGRALTPRDPDAGGTWIAAREDGVMLAIMNVNPERHQDWRSAAGSRSRGLIIPDLLDVPDPARALAHLDPAPFAPFRLIAARLSDGSIEVHTLSWTLKAAPTTERLTAPAAFATSGLGDSVVASRLPLFDELVRPDPDPVAQDRFHRHAWPGRGEESVLMSRPDARTVSITAVEARPGSVRMSYTEVPEAAPGAAPESLGRPEVLTLA